MAGIVKYSSKDFDSIKNNLVNFTKYYFPNEYKDFGEGSIGMMFIKQLSYLGDILSFYTDTQLSENFQDYATDAFNIINNAKALGYKPKLGGSSQTTLAVSQIIPSTSYPWTPDMRYALRVNSLQASSDEFGINFIAKDNIDFSMTGSLDTTVEVLEKNDNNEVLTFLVTKQVDAYSGTIKEYQYTITDSQKYLSIELPDTNIIAIDSIVDSEGNTWHEVPYLSHDLIFENVLTENDPSLTQYKSSVPYLLKYKRVTKRFVTGINENLRMFVQFGAGTNNVADELVIPNPTINYTNFNRPIDPRNILSTRTYGEVPNNTTLTIKYIKGYEDSANTPANSITSISNYSVSSNVNFVGAELELYNYISSNLTVTNVSPAVGSVGMESLESIKLNSKAHFSSQDRCVTIPDYEVRILSLPPKYGGIYKVKIIKDLNSSLGAYCLTKNDTGNLTQLNNAIKTNLINYLDYYKIATDSINIRDAYVINIGVEFDILTKSSVTNKNEVLLKCINALKDYFNIDKWQIGQPIILSEIYNLLDDITGVMTVKNVKIVNKYDPDGISYSNNFYNIEEAGSITPGIIYTAVDPSIFEVKNLNTDIYGRVL